MKKIKLFPSPHVEIRIHVSDQMEKDYAECMKNSRAGIDSEGFPCDECSWGDITICDMGACELKELKEQLGGK